MQHQRLMLSTLGNKTSFLFFRPIGWVVSEILKGISLSSCPLHNLIYLTHLVRHSEGLSKAYQIQMKGTFKYVHILKCMLYGNAQRKHCLPDIQLTGGNLQLVPLLQVHNSSIPLAFVINVYGKTSDQPPDHNDH